MATVAILGVAVNGTCTISAGPQHSCYGPFVSVCTFTNATNHVLRFDWPAFPMAEQFRMRLAAVPGCPDLFTYSPHRHLDTACATLELSGLSAHGAVTLNGNAVDTATAWNTFYPANHNDFIEFCVNFREKLTIKTCSGRVRIADAAGEKPLDANKVVCREPDRSPPPIFITKKMLEDNGFMHPSVEEALLVIAALASAVAIGIAVVALSEKQRVGYNQIRTVVGDKSFLNFT